ncbi:hypothetical protein SPRG_22185 [Saprolegnia parasitica CBS 223.65]|uniref:GST C-terminal domain-containing protein n=1 Tax=Saprolegnia parasitica (strain CBS 223.65) TaxID=695850 RepID=A0A067CNV5_SAPPC|nr:hypothetical protein SPRG_22185 [Saprolegnia parasitica CBS 223.65]KDO28181.1 hypothetical protein SPRG_22185 [Saprolegnia parasitica CBS 223.65]|eukprot:XP_012201151.1 hypothetical protein SPRG_22185 [Saprolegnia parasitica CBS 223.65]
MVAPQLQLTYFSIPGRAELIRLVLAYGHVAFDDIRLSFPEYFEKKSSLDLPFGQLAGLYPVDALLALEADAVVDAILELVNVVVDAVFKTKDETLRATKFEAINGEIFPRMLQQLEARVAGPYFTGAQITFADVYLLDFFLNTLSNDSVTIRLAEYPKLQAIVDRTRALPQLQTYLSK